MLSQSGVLASSKSASQTLAPELSALMVIFRSVGPVISTRRSTRPGRGRGHPPVRVVPDGPGGGQEVEHRPGGQFLLPGRPGGEQLGAAAAELPLQRRDQVDAPPG